MVVRQDLGSRIIMNETTTTTFEPFPEEQRLKIERRSPKPVQPKMPESYDKEMFNKLPKSAQAVMMGVPVPERQHPNPHKKGPAALPVSMVEPQIPTSHSSPGVVLNRIPQTAPTVPQIAEPTGILIDLPSKYAFYGFKDLYVQPIKAMHLAKLARAHAERSFAITVEAISSLLSTTDKRYEGMSLGHLLTIPDFYYVMYFVRINDFSKTTFIHRDVCRNPAHIEKVHKGEMHEDTLKIESRITKSDLETIYLEEIPYIDPSLVNGLTISAPTTARTIEFVEHPAFTDPEVEWLGAIATHIEAPTFEERLRLASELSPDQIQMVKDFELAVANYGVKETINIKCSGCGASRKTTVNIDAHSFLPS